MSHAALKLGDVVYVWWIPGLIKHYGIVVEEGIFNEPRIRTVSPWSKEPIEQTYSQFGDGSPIYRHSTPTRLSGWQAAQRARSVTKFDYNLITRNCEHFYKYAHGLPQVSDQIVMAGIACIFVGLAFSKGRITLT